MRTPERFSLPAWEELRNLTKAQRYELMFKILRHSLAAQIRAIRKERNLTHSQLAELSDTSMMTVWRYQKSWNKRWNINTLIKIAAAFDCALVCQFCAWSELYKFIHLSFVITPEGVLEFTNVPKSFLNEDNL